MSTLRLLGICAIATAVAILAPSAIGQDSPATSAQTPAAGQPAARRILPPSNIKEQVIGEAAVGSEIVTARSTDDHLAWIEKAAGNRTVKLDGKQIGGTYQEVSYLRFSNDEQHLGFIAKRNSKWVVVLDGEERSSEYGKMTAPALAANGRLYAVGACREKKCRLVVNGEEVGPEFEDISPPMFVHNSDRYVYFGKRAKKWVILVDGKESGPEMDGIEQWTTDREGKRIAVAGLLNKQWRWIVDGTPGPGFDVLSEITFSPDGKHYAYGATEAKWGFSKHKTRGVIVEDGRVLGTYEGSGFGGGWQSMFGASYEIVTGVRQLFPDFHGVSDPQYTSDGALVYAGRRGQGDVSVYLDGVAGPVFEDVVSPIIIAGESNRMAYVGKRGDQFIEVRNQKPGASFPGKRELSFVPFMVLSHDGDHLAYEIVRGGGQFKAGYTSRALRRMVIDGQAAAEYDAFGIVDFEFSSDNRRHFYVVRGAEGRRDRVIFNGFEGRLYDDVFLRSTKFIDEQSIEFIAQDGLRFLRVTQRID